MAFFDIRASIVTAFAVYLVSVSAGPASAEEPLLAQAAPTPSPRHIQRALSYGDQFQAQMPNRIPRYTTPPMAIPPEYRRVPDPAYCTRYPYAPYCIPPVIIPRYSPSPVWRWQRWHYDETTGWELQ